MSILSFGEVLWDVYSDNKYIGGAPFNFAAHLARHGEKVYMLTCVGSDQLGDEAAEIIRKFGICTDLVKQSDSKKTGQCLVTLDSNFVPTYNLLSDVAYDFIDCSNVTDKFDVLYFGTMALRSEHNINSLKDLLGKNIFKEIFVDINIRKPYYSEETVSLAAENATIIKISDEEMPVVAKLLGIDDKCGYLQFAKNLSGRFSNIKMIILTLGAKGAYVLDAVNGTDYYCDSSKVEVVSTVGAGDSFSASFLHKYLSGFGIDECLKYATRVAGFVVSKYDAIPEYQPNNI